MSSRPVVAYGPGAWKGAAAALFVVGWGANQFSSLLLSYRAHQHLSTATADALFGVYAVGLIPALLIGGRISDRHGRRMVVPVVALSAVASGVLILGASAGLAALYPGRFLAGVVSGLAFAPGTAWVKELSDLAASGGSEGPHLGARRAAVALSAGFGLGPLVAGLLAQWAPAPLVVPYLAHLLVVAVAAPLVLRTPETIDAAHARDAPSTGVADGVAGRSLPFGAGDARFTRVAAPMAPWVFAAAAISFAVLPAQVTHRTHNYSIAFAAVVAGLTLAVGVSIQPVARRLDDHRNSLGAQIGLLSVIVGLLVGALAASQDQPLLVLVAAVFLGAGYGTCLVSGLLEVQRIAPAHHLAGLTAVYYALTYLGFAAPILLAAAAPLASYPDLLVLTAALCSLTLAAMHRGSTIDMTLGAP